MHLPEAVPGRPSWQLLTSAANPGKLPARDRDERQRKSETGLKVGGPGPQPPASPSCAPISFFSKPSQPRRLMSGHGAAGASGREPLLLCSKSRGRAVRRAQLPPAPRLQVSPSQWGGRGRHHWLGFWADSHWSHVGCRKSRGKWNLSQSPSPSQEHHSSPLSCHLSLTAPRMCVPLYRGGH